MSSQAAIIDEYRSFYARYVATQGRQRDQPVGCAFVTRLEGAFATVPRELFLPPGPWHIFAVLGGRYVETPSTDAWYVYQDVLVAIDKDRGIHNGQPSIHAAFMSAVEPQPGETLIHVGAGTGYYTAILSMLVAPGGRVEAIEVDEALARTAKRNLAAFDNVSVTIGNASKMSLPAANVIYVSAGVRWPPVHWLEALEPEGRLFVPWRPAPDIGIALCITRRPNRFEVKPLMQAWFIPCAGASEASPGDKMPDRDAAWATRSLHLVCERKPDDTATAIYRDIWFSSERRE